MIWPFLPLLAAYGCGAWVTWYLGHSLVGESRVGRKAVPVCAALWFVLLPLLITIGGLAAIEHAFDRATGWMRDPEDLR